MKKNNSYLFDNEINLTALIKELWKEKILILFISIICGLLSYGSQYFQTKEFRTQVKIKNPPVQLFMRYSFDNTRFIVNLTKGNNDSLIRNNLEGLTVTNHYSLFISQFYTNLSSLDNFETFLEQNKSGRYDNFKAFLKSKSITAKSLFIDNKLGIIKSKNDYTSDIIFLFFPEALDGPNALNEYVEFTRKMTVIEYKNNLKNNIQFNINFYEEILEISKLEKKIDLFINKTLDSSFPLHASVLEQVNYLKKMLKRLENEEFNYNPILEKATNFSLENKISPIISTFIGLLLGFIFSIVIVLFKLNVKYKS
jgi:LPS O-antigen subunit length determinant protein (WzzB/FepE family)